MSLKYLSSGSVPAQTVRVARAAFPKGNSYLKLRDEFGTFMTMPILRLSFRCAVVPPNLRCA